MKRRIGPLACYLAVVALISSCLGDPTGPGAREGAFAVAPRFPSLLANALVDIAAVRLIVTRSAGSAPIVDTVVVFQPADDSVAVTITVPLDSRNLDFMLTLAMTNAQGDTIFRAGPLPVRVGTTPIAVSIARPSLIYVGVGSNATAVRFVNPPLALLFGQSAALVAEAVDGQGTVIPGTPIGFQLVNAADTALATIADPAVGMIVARAQRGAVQVSARTLSGQTALHTLVIQPTATNVIAQAGGGQTGTVGQALAQPLVARVRAADGLGVRGIPVNFEVLTGGGTLSRLVDTTDINGDARATLTLGSLPGAQTARAVVPSLGGAVAGFSVTGVAGAATQLVFGVQPASTTSGIVLAPAVTVRARDQFGNDAPSFTGNVIVALQNNPSGAVLLGTLTRAAVAGVATFNDLALTGLGTGITLRATSGALTAATSAGFNITVGPVVALAFATQPAATLPATPFSVGVEARDAGGNRVTSFISAVGLAFGANPVGGTLSGTTSVNAVAGLATFTGLSIDNIGLGFTLVATRTGLTTATSVPFNVGSPAGVNAWVNATGGNWSTPGNWSLGTVPTAADTVWIRQSGTYTVNVDVAATVGRMLVGGTSGTQTLNVSGAVLTLNDSALVSANGAVVVSGGGIAGAGAMAVASTFTWTAGNLVGTGARVRVLAGGTLAIGGTAARSFSGFTLENSGTGTWTGTATINSGSAATLRVMAGGSLAIQGDPQWLYTLGGALPRLENLSTVLRTGTGIAVIGAQLIDTVGTSFDLQAGELRLENGGRISGTRLLSGGSLELAAGTLSMKNGTLWSGTGGYVRVTGGTLTLDSAATVTLPRLDLAGGLVTHEGLLDVTTTMNWSGGNLASNTVGLGGTTRVRAGGLLTVSGATARTFTGTHLLQLLGNTNFAATGAINAGSGATIVSSGLFDLQGSGSILYNQGGAATLFQNGPGATLRSSGATTGQISFPVQNVGALSVTGDSLRLSGGSANFFAGTAAVTSNALFLAGGTFTLTGTLTIAGAAGNVVVGGTLDLNSNTLSVSGSLATVGAGSVQGTTATSLVNITGNAAFGGGASSFTAGQMQLGGSFTQSGATNSFLASGTHRTVLNGSGTQNISFANPTVSRFNRLDLSATTRDIVLQTDAFVADTLIMQGGAGASTLIGAGTTQRLTANGALVMILSTLSPRLAPPVLEINSAPAVGNIAAPRGLNPDTAVFIGGNITALPTGLGYNYKSIRVGGGATFSFGADTIAGDLHIASTLGFFGGSTTFRIGGKLRVTGTGQLGIVSTDTYVTVVDSAIFAGGTTNGILTAGNLIVQGAFVQSGGDPAAFSATGTFKVSLAGSGLQQVRFVNPDSTATSSHFADLEIANSSVAGVQFLSPVFAVNQLRSLPGRPAISRVAGSSVTPLTINGILADSITFDGVPLRIAGTAALSNMSVFTFQNMNPAVNQFTITRPGLVGTFFPNQVVFSTVPNAGSYYLVMTNTSVTGLGLAATFFNSSPAAGSMTGRYQRLGAPVPVLTWNGILNP